MAAGLTIAAAVYRDGQKDPQRELLRITDLRDDEAVVRIVATGVCHTDLTCRDGFMALPRPMVLGHEGAGIVELVGAGISDIVPGDAVVLTFQSCGACWTCDAGKPAYCLKFGARNLTGRRADGSSAMSSGTEPLSTHFFGQSSFATHSVVGRRNMVKVAHDLPLDLLGPLGCSVQTGAGAVMNVLQPGAGASLLVTGAGGVGLSAVMAGVVMACAPIIVVEPNAARRAIALDVGATHAIDPHAPGDLVEHILAVNGPIAHALDTSGQGVVIAQALAALGMLGKMVLVTGSSLTASIELPLLSLVARGITIRGVNMGDSVPEDFIPQLAQLVASGRFPLERITRFYDFADIGKAFDDQASGQVIKPIIRMN